MKELDFFTRRGYITYRDRFGMRTFVPHTQLALKEAITKRIQLMDDITRAKHLKRHQLKHSLELLLEDRRIFA